MEYKTGIMIPQQTLTGIRKFSTSIQNYFVAKEF